MLSPHHWKFTLGSIFFSPGHLIKGDIHLYLIVAISIILKFWRYDLLRKCIDILACWYTKQFAFNTVSKYKLDLGQIVRQGWPWIWQFKPQIPRYQILIFLTLFLLFCDTFSACGILHSLHYCLFTIFAFFKTDPIYGTFIHVKCISTINLFGTIKTTQQCTVHFQMPMNLNGPAVSNNVQSLLFSCAFT